ncbi:MULTISPECIES: methyltransferase family protein [unclassified Sphingomonas]|uniref:methyltransferase family protein n=1 Tax=unclassified Sphingomonas TaxID=196159 RepID=UPI0021515FB1|nr:MULTISPECIES: isoprenylcysteine carboxylmethyltransferase family protein [unclassified Sphingomonas]MCR5872394.1 isoprenylcysteine carboxylmethyltransferase family protein [Sphingomonas sp. J344]UUX99317.1 isoprenylcysteine carboxylmethyltransferase family protein [Sphingomonas sp. J315]
MTDTKSDIPGVIAPPPLIFLGYLIAGIALEYLVVRTQGLDMPDSLRWTVVALFLLSGLGLIAAALVRFKAAGTPAPPWQPTTAFVVQGVYRWTRNPMYLGMTLIYLGLAVAANAPVVLWLFIPLILTIHYGVIAREERYMADKFGVSYINYAHRVPRWL